MRVADWMAAAVVVLLANLSPGHGSRRSKRIVGRQPAAPGQWPWMAALLNDGAPEIFCGGVLVSDRHVLTGANCVDKRNPGHIIVRLGEHDWRNAAAEERDYRVSDIFVHEQYERVSNDIALLKLTEQVAFNDFVKPIDLPPSSDLALEDQLVSVTGWGTTSYRGAVSDVLQEVELPVWRQAECRAANSPYEISDAQLCAGYEAGGQGACTGDSGGPLMYRTAADRWIAAGIVSWGIGCDQPGKPNVYTRVASYLDWIDEKMALRR